MGTNYYMMFGRCECCGRAESEMHIGKSSGGWNFALNTHPENGLKTLADWQAVWALHPIKDEYGQVITPEEMLRTVAERKPWRDDEPLLRHEIDGTHCLAHGDGTYDIMNGYFS